MPKTKWNKLVSQGWATWDRSSRRFTACLEQPESGFSVPVVVVGSEGTWKIPHVLLRHLWNHSGIVEEVEVTEEETPEEGFQFLLRWVRGLADDHELEDEERIPSVASQEGPRQRAAICLVAEENLTSYLNVDRGCGDVIRGQQERATSPPVRRRPGMAHRGEEGKTSMATSSSRSRFRAIYGGLSDLRGLHSGRYNSAASFRKSGQTDVSERPCRGSNHRGISNP